MKADRQAPIGVFDSGVGGLTVVREIMRNLPDERIVYFGDTARVPYGSKSKNTVIRYSRQIVHFLETQQVKAIVIACNTATAASVSKVRQLMNQYSMPIISIEPAIKPACALPGTGKVFMMATLATTRLNRYLALQARMPDPSRVINIPCPGIVERVEAGIFDDDAYDDLFDKYFAPYVGTEVDAIVLGCTHYPLAKTFFRAALPGVKVVSQDELMAAKLENYLTRHPEIESLLTRGGTYRFEVSSLNRHAQKVAALLFPDIPVEKAANG